MQTQMRGTGQEKNPGNTLCTWIHRFLQDPIAVCIMSNIGKCTYKRMFVVVVMVQTNPEWKSNQSFDVIRNLILYRNKCRQFCTKQGRYPISEAETLNVRRTVPSSPPIIITPYTMHSQSSKKFKNTTSLLRICLMCESSTKTKST